jgi:hypothetical protein
MTGMAFLHSFNPTDFLDSLISLFGAFVLGGLIGVERQYRRRGGGLRTHVLVSVGAATFVDHRREFRQLAVHEIGAVMRDPALTYDLCGTMPRSAEMRDDVSIRTFATQASHTRGSS